MAINNDFLYSSSDVVEAQNTATDRLYWLHNVEMTLGTSLTYFYRQFEATPGLTVRKEFNDDYIYEKDQTHVGFEFSIRYRLSELR